MYAQTAVKPYILHRNGATPIVMRGVQKCTGAGASLRDRNVLPLCCINLDTATERLWNTGGKNWTYEYKYRRGGKNLCCLYAKRNCVGFLIIFGKEERQKFEDIRDTLSTTVCRQYDEAKTYHDGKWVMFYPTSTAEFDDYMKLLAVKRKPNRKQGKAR